MACKARIFGLFLASTVAIQQTHAQEFDRIFDTARITHQTYKSEPKQVVVNKPKAEKIPKTEMSLGYRLNTDGWGLFTDYGRSKIIDSKHGDRFYHLRFLQVEIGEKKSPREIKSTSAAGGNSSGSSTYIYGKINNFYFLKLGYGLRKMIAGKTDNAGSVSIHWVNVFGPVLGFLKPYYLNLAGAPAAIKYTDNEATFLNSNQILGSAGFSKGFSEGVFVPGAYYRTAFHFDITGNLKTVMAIEAGMDVSAFSQNIQIMATTPATPYFVDVFLSFQLGRRW